MGETRKKGYVKPEIKKVSKMDFPQRIIESKGKGVVCKQCSSCHSCR